MSYYTEGYVYWQKPEDNWNYKVDEYSIQDNKNQLGICAVKVKDNNDYYRMYIFGTTGVPMTYDASHDGDFKTWLPTYTAQYSYIKYRGSAHAGSYENPDGNFTNVQIREVGGTNFPFVPSPENGRRFIDNVEFPMYDFSSGNPSSDDMKRINDYIEDGDDHGADNYDHLHPTQLRFDVWVDGTFPSLYVKPSVNSGEYTGGETLGIEIIVNPTLNPTTTYINDNLVIDTMGYINYTEYAKANAIVFTNYEIKCRRNDHICLGSLSINVDGSVRSHEDGATDDILIVFHDGTPSDNDYPESNNIWNTDPTTNEFSGANTLTQTYEITEQNLQALGNFMWSSTFKDNIFGLVNSPIENIVSLKAMPIHGEGIADDKEIKIGNVSTGIHGTMVPFADGIKKTVNKNGKLKMISGTFDNFVDYTNYDIQVYLPFIGFKSLDPIVYVNRNVLLEYIYDTIYGNVLAVLTVYDSNNNPLVHDVFQGSCGIDIAITSTNRGQIENGYIGAGLSALSDLAKGNVIGLASDVFGGVSQEFHSQSNGVGNPSLLNKLDMTAKFIVKKPVMFEPQEYGHIVGYPCYQYKSLNDVSGTSTDKTPYNKFVKCKDFICSHIYNALDEEKKEIEQLMKEGVYL